MSVQIRTDELIRLLRPEFSSAGGIPSTAITGTGIAPRVAFFSGPQTITSDSGMTYDSATDELSIGSLQFDITPVSTATVEGRLWWDTNDGTLNLGMPGGNVNLQLGQEMLIRAKNETGGPINNGQLVYISSGTGSRPIISLAKADAEATSASTIGMATETIADTHNGYVTTFGMVRDIDTIAYAPGTILYLSAATAGAYTSSAPTAPNHRVMIGTVVRQHATEGVIYVSVDNGYEISELHDVLISGIADNDILQYNAGSGVWKNETLAASGLVSGSGTANYVAKWSSATALTNSLIRDDGTTLGVGTAPTTNSILTLAGTYTFSATGQQQISNYTPLFTPSGASLNSFFGQLYNPRIGTSSTPITSAYASYLRLDTVATYASTISNLTTLGLAAASIGAGTITNASGLGIAEVVAGASRNSNFTCGTLGIPVGAWSIYNNSTRDNYFGGNLSIGSTTLAASLAKGLQLVGSTAASGNVTDGVILYENDRGGTAGKGSLHIRAEDGTISILGDRAGLLTSTPLLPTHCYSSPGNAGHWSGTNIDGTAQTIIANVSGDITEACTVQYTAAEITGTNVGGGVCVLEPNTSYIVCSDGTNSLTLTCAADGSLTVARSAGTDTYKFTCWVTWI